MGAFMDAERRDSESGAELEGKIVLKRLVLWLVVAVVVLIGFLLYRSRSGNDLNVTPEAEREIEKAKRR
jgi:hypothetical protein